MPPRPPCTLVVIASLAVACAPKNETIGGATVTLSPDAATGTGGTAGSGAGAAGGGGVRSGMMTGELPCDVAAVLEARCQSCHRRPPVFGAPMPLLSFADLQAQAPTTTGAVWQAMKSKLAAGLMPPPNTPSGPLTASEKATLTAWLEAGAPPRSGSACSTGGNADAGLPTAMPPSGVDALPCKPQYQFRASGATANAPYEVPLANNTYRCFTFPVPFGAGEQAIAWAPIVDDARVLHHWILYGHGNDTMPSGCGDTGRIFLMGWAPGGQNGLLPADVGLELPNAGSWLTLEVHYNNTARVTDARDRSGVAVCTTETPRPKEAGVVTLGSIGIAIPPQATNHSVTSVIPGSLTRLIPEPLHVLWTWPHMHVAGTSFRTDLVRGDKTISLVDVPAWDFNNQRAYLRDPETTLILPGDTLRTVCTYKNSTAASIRFGEKTENEMCFNFLAVYPITRLANRQWVTAF